MNHSLYVKMLSKIIIIASYRLVWNISFWRKKPNNRGIRTPLDNVVLCIYVFLTPRLQPSHKQCPADVLLWSYFGRDVPDHNRTKIGRIRFLTYFDRAISDRQLESEKIEKIPWKTTLWIMIKLTSWVRPKDAPLRMRPLALHIGLYEDVLRTSRPFSGTSSERPRGRNFANWP